MLTTRSALNQHLRDLLATPAPSSVPPKHALTWDIQEYTQTTANEALLYIDFETEGFIGAKSAFVLKETKKAANSVL